MIEIDMLRGSGQLNRDTDSSIDAILAAMLWPHDRNTSERFKLFRSGGLDTKEFKIIKKFLRGLAFGFILFNCVSKMHYGESFKISNCKSALEVLDKFKLSQKAIDNDIWPNYRSVLPLWAANIWLISCGFLNRSVILCTRETLRDFIFAAEAFKDISKRSRTPRSKERALLRADDGYQLSERIGEIAGVRPSPAFDLIVKLNQFPD